MIKQVLIADDNKGVRQVMKRFLGQWPELAVCAEAANGLEAVEKARSLKPDLILLDVAMPEMNGAEAASVLNKALPDASIVLFTMYGEKIGRHLTDAIGVDAVLSKPDGMTALADIIDAVLARGPGPKPHRPRPGNAATNEADEDPAPDPKEPA